MSRYNNISMNSEKTTEQSRYERGPSRGNFDRGSDRSIGRGAPRNYYQDGDRSYDHGPRRGYGHDHDNGQRRGYDRGYDRGNDHGNDRGNDRGNDHGPRRQVRGYDRPRYNEQEVPLTTTSTTTSTSTTNTTTTVPTSSAVGARMVMIDGNETFVFDDSSVSSPYDPKSMLSIEVNGQPFNVSGIETVLETTAIDHFSNIKIVDGKLCIYLGPIDQYDDDQEREEKILFLGEHIHEKYLLPEGCGEDKRMIYVLSQMQLWISRLMAKIYGYGWSGLRTIQCICIPSIMAGLDGIYQEKSGQGKTGGFVIPNLMVNFDPRNRKTQLIFVTNTGLVAKQIYELIMHLTSDEGLPRNSDGTLKNPGFSFPKINVFLAIGRSENRELGSLKQMCVIEDAQIIVGCVGSIYNAVVVRAIQSERRIQRRRERPVDVSSVTAFICDECDVILDENQRRQDGDTVAQQIREIVAKIPANASRHWFSATYKPDTIEKVSELIRKNSQPAIIMLPEEQSTLMNIISKYIHFTRRGRGDRGDIHNEKFAALLEILTTMSVTRCVIFVNSREMAELLAYFLQDTNNLYPDAIGFFHAMMPEQEKNRSIADFKNGTYRVLICSDFAARGVDVSGVTHVINFDMPRDVETFIHRIGRTGRGGINGISISFVEHDLEQWKTVLAERGTVFTELLEEDLRQFGSV